jgi:hypothetical protein
MCRHLWIRSKGSGFDRRAEYLKGIFEVFEFDPELKAKCDNEFKGYENPLSGYMWQEGIRPFTIIATGKSAGSANGTGSMLPKGLHINIFSTGNGHNLKKLCDSILFIASLGGGTGTGFINPSPAMSDPKSPSFHLCSRHLTRRARIRGMPRRAKGSRSCHRHVRPAHKRVR